MDHAQQKACTLRRSQTSPPFVFLTQTLTFIQMVTTNHVNNMTTQTTLPLSLTKLPKHPQNNKRISLPFLKLPVFPVSVTVNSLWWWKHSQQHVSSPRANRGILASVRRLPDSSAAYRLYTHTHTHYSTYSHMLPLARLDQTEGWGEGVCALAESEPALSSLWFSPSLSHMHSPCPPPLISPLCLSFSLSPSLSNFTSPGLPIDCQHVCWVCASKPLDVPVLFLIAGSLASSSTHTKNKDTQIQWTSRGMHKQIRLHKHKHIWVQYMDRHCKCEDFSKKIENE